ncbi:hypothetical protein WJS35_000107 [Escherichia coli]
MFSKLAPSSIKAMI